MKMKNGKLVREGDKTTVYGTFKDRMRRPANVKLDVRYGPELEPDDKIYTGPSDETADVLFCLADIAWSAGWRPRGLMGKAAQLIETYHIPPDVR